MERTMNNQEIQTIQSSSNAFIEMANAHMVLDQEQADKANDILKTITNGLKQIEDKRKSFTAPLNQSLKEINATFKQIVEPIENAKSALTKRLMQWRSQEQERIRQEQEKARKEEERRLKIQEAHAAKGHNCKETITPVLAPMPFSVNDTTKTQLRWTYEVVDVSQVPLQYMIIDGPEITKAVREGVRDIPGVKIFQKEIAVFG
jgi:malate synthase